MRALQPQCVPCRPTYTSAHPTSPTSDGKEAAFPHPQGKEAAASTKPADPAESTQPPLLMHLLVVLFHAAVLLPCSCSELPCTPALSV